MHEGLFKANDIRGRYPGELNEEGAFLIGRGAARLFRPGRVVVARDVRVSSPALYRAVLRGIRAAGRRHTTVGAGITTTPWFYFLVHESKAAGGIMVTASHNPKEYNGFKVVGPRAVPLSGRELWAVVVREERARSL